ncbi:hypothetical protein MNJPNG_12320 [Cupriavidus oxalaticus]
MPPARKRVLRAGIFVINRHPFLHRAALGAR